MKVFKSEVCCCYGGGVIMIAANSKEEALNVASRESKYDYLFKGWDFEANEEIVEINDDLSPFEEVQGLEYKTIVPTIIVENIYRE